MAKLFTFRWQFTYSDVEWLFPSHKTKFNVEQANELLPFSLPRVKEYLSKLDNNLVEKDYEELFEICEGHADKITELRRIFLQDKSFSSILNDKENYSQSIYHREISRLESDNDAMSLMLLAVIAYASIQVSPELLTAILDCPLQKIYELLGRNADFIILDNGIVRFRSEALLKYMRLYFQNSESEVELRLLSVYESRDTYYTDAILPLYVKYNKEQELIKFLNDSNIQRLLDTNRSQAALNTQCDYGYNATILNLKKYIGEAFRFSVLKSSSRLIERNELWDNETEALVLHGKVDDAIALANNIYLLEDRLKSLIIIVKKAKNLDAGKKNSLLLEIHRLSQSIEFEHIPEKSIEIARLLLDVDLQLSMDIIEDLVQDEKINIDFDSVYAMLYLSTRKNYLSDSPINDISSYDKIQAKIKDTEIKKMTEAMGLAFSNASPSDIMKKALELPSEIQRIYFLLFWIPGHRDAEGIEEIVLYALHLVVTNSNIDIPKIDIVLGISKALPFFPNKASVFQAIKEIESIESDIKTPTYSYVKVKLLIIEAVAKFDEKKAIDLLLDVYIFIESLPDKSIYIDCLSALLSSYERLGEKRFLETSFMTQNDLLVIIKEAIIEAFNNTAFHFTLVKNPISLLVVNYPSFIKDIAPMMNTEERRSKAFLYASREYIRRTKIEKINWTYFEFLLSGIKYRKRDKEEVLVAFASKLGGTEFNNSILNEIKHRKNLFCDIQDEENLCFVLSQLYSWIVQDNPSDPFADFLYNTIYSVWNSIERIQDKINIGFNLVTSLSSHSSEKAEALLKETLKNNDQSLLTTSSCLEAIDLSIELYTRSLGLMIQFGMCDDNMIAKFRNEINQLGNPGIQIITWAKIALEFFSVNDVLRFNTIVNDLILKPLDSIKKKTTFYQHILINAAPAIFLFSDNAYKQFMKDLDDFSVNLCAIHTCDFVFYKYPYLSDLEYDKHDIHLNYQDCQRILTLLQFITYDDELFMKIDCVCKALKDNRFSDISTTQKSSIIKEILTIAEDKFPMPGGVSHNGYKVACQIATYELLTPTGSKPQWSSIDSQIKTIDNKADQAFLYFFALQYISKIQTQVEFLEKGVAVADTIPSGYDRLTRFAMALEECSYNNCRTQVKTLFKSTLDSIRFENEKDYSFIEQFVDIAYKYDETFANSLIETFDTDTARLFNKGVLRRHLESKKRIKNVESNIDQIRSLTTYEYIDFCKKGYSSLVRGKSIAKSPDTFSSLVQSIYEKPLDEAKNSILYFLEDVRKWNNNHDTNALVRKIYSALSFNFRIVESLSVNSKECLNQLLRAASTGNQPSLIRLGERDKGLRVLYDWYKRYNTLNLKIIDPYFSANDLIALRPLFEYNQDLHLSIITHSKMEDDINNYKIAWLKSVSNLSNCIDIITISYSDKPDEGPLHDRYWFAQDRTRKILVGIKTTSLSNLGNKDSDIEEIEPNKVDDIFEFWNFYSDKVKFLGDKQLVYKSIFF